MLIESVPFIGDRAEKFASCQGPPSVMMVLKFFKPNIIISFEKLYKLMGYSRGKWFFEVYTVRLFDSFGIPVKYYTTEDVINIGNDSVQFRMLCGLDFSAENKAEVDVANFDSAVTYVLLHKLVEKKDEFSFDFLKNLLQQQKLIIVTGNRNTLTGKSGFKGHFLVVKGFNDVGFICNDSYFGENFLIAYDLFRKMFYINKDHRLTCDFVAVG